MLVDPVFDVVMVNVEVFESVAFARATGVVTAHVGGFAVAGVTLHPRFTLPTNPVEVTVTVEVPLLPLLIALGDTAPTATVNAAVSVCGVYFTTKGVLGLGNVAVVVFVGSVA
jgi:hypothetical protein